MRFLGALLLGLSIGVGLASRAQGQARPTPADTSRHVYSYTEKMPVFPVLEPADSARNTMQRVVRFLQRDLHYPPKALRDQVQGRVLFSFAVNEQGRTADLKLVRGLRADVDAEVLRNAHRLDSIRWQPGTQNGRPVRVAFTVPLTLTVTDRAGQPVGDSLDLPRYRGFKLPSGSWNLAKAPRAGTGIIYGSCLQRLGFSSGGLGQYVRVVNLTTGQTFRLNVKPAMRSRRENSFSYALPAGRYALSTYEFSNGFTLSEERLRKPTGSVGGGEAVAATRYTFTVAPGSLHYVGTWNFANASEPFFLNEKELLDPVLLAEYPGAPLAEAVVALPQ